MKSFFEETCISLTVASHPINGKCGEVSVEGLKLSPEELDNIVPFPVWWHVQVNGVAHMVGEPVTVAQGEPLTVAVSVTSKAGMPTLFVT